MKNLFLVVVLLLVASNLTFSQKKGDKSPMPIGGMEAVAKKVVYPDEIKGKNIKGEVQVMVTVDSTGSILATKIYKALHPACDSAAVKAVRSVKFKPGEKNGKKAIKKVIIPISF
ncbi:MAG: TonB family protein [Ignavibacteriales bacterium]|nr:TonB family protein [Ignavibacteriales bacterium]